MGTHTDTPPRRRTSPQADAGHEPFTRFVPGTRITERSYRRPRRFRLLLGCLNPLPIPYVMQDGTFNQRKGRNETGHNLTSTFISETRKARILRLYKNNARIYSQSKNTTQSYNRIKRQLLTAQSLIQVYLQDWRHTYIYTKSKENKSHPHRQGGRQVRGPNARGTWMSGQVHETEGSYPRPRGAMASKPQCQRSCA